MSKIRKTTTADHDVITNGKYFADGALQCSIDDPIFPDMIDHHTIKSIRVESLDFDYALTVWLDWNVKINENINGQFTLRAETRNGKKTWYAYRRVLGTLHKRHVGTSEKINNVKLLEIARKLPG